MYSVIRVSGDDRVEFLQGQLTQDVSLLDDGVPRLAAWCSAKGRVLTVMRLLPMDAAVGLSVPTGMAEALLGRLTMYRFRAKVDLDLVPDAVSFAVRQDGPALQASLDRPDVWAFTLADGVVELHGESAGALAGIDEQQWLPDRAWRVARLRAGQVDIDAATTEQFTPHMLNLDRVGAISFEKGCYTGQEIVARTENLGRVKRRLNLYKIKNGSAAAGDELMHDGKKVGEIVEAAGDYCLAIVPVERKNDALDIGGSTAVPEPLPYPVD